MKVKVFNNDNLKDEEISDKVVRVKCIMINSRNEILLGESYGTIQFPGGHLENDETLEGGLVRELKEETGIDLKEKLEPFYAIKHYIKDCPVVGNNRSLEIYYFIYYTDEEYNISETNFDDKERIGDYHLYYIPIKKVKKILKKSIPNNPVNEVVVEEMLLALKEFKKVRR